MQNFSRFRGEADVSRPVRPAQSVENDPFLPLQTFICCDALWAPYVAVGLIRNLESADNRGFLDAGGLKLFTDRLLRGKSDPTACPGVRGVVDADWTNLSELSSEPLISR
jgi:hypothetical protein